LNNVNDQSLDLHSAKNFVFLFHFKSSGRLLAFILV